MGDRDFLDAVLSATEESQQRLSDARRVFLEKFAAGEEPTDRDFKRLLAATKPIANIMTTARQAEDQSRSGRRALDLRDEERGNVAEYASARSAGVSDSLRKFREREDDPEYRSIAERRRQELEAARRKAEQRAAADREALYQSVRREKLKPRLTRGAPEGSRRYNEDV